MVIHNSQIKVQDDRKVTIEESKTGGDPGAQTHLNPNQVAEIVVQDPIADDYSQDNFIVEAEGI